MQQQSSQPSNSPSTSELEGHIVEALEIADSIGLTLVGCRLEEALDALREAKLAQ